MPIVHKYQNIVEKLMIIGYTLNNCEILIKPYPCNANCIKKKNVSMVIWDNVTVN